MENITEEKKKNSFFGWHLYPEDPISIKSVVEVCIFTIIVFVCGFLYYKWNQVPVKELSIVMEDLSDGRYIINRDSFPSVLSANVKITIPMTTHQEMIKDSSSVEISYKPLLPDTHHSDIIKLSFFYDSLRNGWRNDTLSPRELNVLSKYKIWRNRIIIDNKYRNSETKGDFIKSKLDSLKNFVPFDSDSSFCSYHMWKISTQSLHPQFSSEGSLYNDSIISFSGVEGNKIYEITYMLSNKYPQHGFGYSTVFFDRLFHWYNIFDFYYPFYDINPIKSPRWGKLEDISQSYVILKLNSKSIDSIKLTFDFVGATDFSKMIPEPDSVNMNSIVFTDPVKLYKIRSQGLQFHAKFVELQNFQQIRVFSVTAIMSAFVLGFVVFIINAYFKLRRRYLLGQVLSSSLKRKLVKGIFVVIPMYIFIYWTSIYFIIPHFDSSVVRILLCNIITFFVIFVILSIFDSSLRKKNNALMKRIYSFLFPRN